MSIIRPRTGMELLFMSTNDGGSISGGGAGFQGQWILEFTFRKTELL